MPESRLERYHRKKREKEYKAGKSFKKAVSWRKKAHPIIAGVIGFSNNLAGRKCIVLHDENASTDKPVIYAVTHIGRYDVDMVVAHMKKNAHIFMGDPGNIYTDPLGIVLWINGVVFADLDYKMDRHIALETGIKILEERGNIIIFPEGAWNTTENKPVMQLFSGAIEMAIRAGAEIVPIAVEQYEKEYYLNVGENIDCSNWSLQSKKAHAQELRDKMSTLKWEIWEQFPLEKRKNLSEDYSKIFIDKIMSETENDYTLERIYETRYTDRHNVEPEEAFAFMQQLIPRWENAFLFRSRGY